jgi:hypothetical protein
MRWVVHIGTQKTGSKAIQGFLVRSAGQIAQSRVLFAPQGRQGGWHQPLFFKLFDGDGGDLDAAVSDTDPRDWDIGVFSCEAFHELLPHRIRIMREKLGPAQIVVFIRPQVDAINSLLNQYAKAHRMSFDGVMTFQRSIAHYNPDFDYHAMLGKWADAFGSDNITPVIYDKRSDAVPLFCRAIGVPVPATYRAAPNPNPALTRSAYEAFLSAKAAVADPCDLPELVTRLHRDYRDEMIDTLREPGPLLFDDRTRREILRLYEASNEQVRAQWFPSRPTIFEHAEMS